MINKLARLIPAALCLLAATAVSADEINRCVLVVHGATFMDAPCYFDASEDGSFTLGVSETVADASPYFVYLGVDEENPDKAEGFWNGFPPESRAHEPLGDLHRQGACWVNSVARICAYR